MTDLMQDMLAQFTALPPRGRPAAELTDRDKVALAVAAGVPTELVMVGTTLTLRTLKDVGFADRGDGGYIIGVRA